MLRLFKLSLAVCALAVFGPGWAAVQAGDKSVALPHPTSGEAQPFAGTSHVNWKPDAVLDDSASQLTSAFEPVVRGQSEGELAQSVTGPACAERHWWVVAPYVWIPGIYGQITTFGTTRSVSIDTSDVLSNLDDANGALQLHLESGVDRVGLIVDTNLIRFSQTSTVGAAAVDVDLQQTLLEVLGMYRLLEGTTPGMSKQPYSIDLLGGGRYYNFTNDVTITPFDPTLPAVPLGQSATWVDLVFGVRGRAPIFVGLDGFVRADFGGFGIGTSSSLAWNLIAGLDWHATDHLSFLAGYRVFDVDASQGEGTSRFAFDAKMQGPFMAFSLQY